MSSYVHNVYHIHDGLVNLNEDTIYNPSLLVPSLNDSATLLWAFIFFWWSPKGLGSMWNRKSVKTHLLVQRREESLAWNPGAHNVLCNNTGAGRKKKAYRRKMAGKFITSSSHPRLGLEPGLRKTECKRLSQFKSKGMKMTIMFPHKLTQLFPAGE
jgi:hypothetical protein